MISVITPTYKTPPDILNRTYASLLTQTFTDWEWVIIDDSPDDHHLTWQQINAYAAHDARIRPFRPRHSGSIGRVKRWGFMLAEGHFLVELDHDDELLPEALQRTHDAFTQNPDVGFVYSDWAECFPDGTYGTYPDGWAFGYGETLWHPQRQHHYMGTAEINPVTVRHIVSAPNHLRAWRSTTYHEMNGHDARYEVCDDYQLYVRTFLHTRLHHIPELLYIQHIAPVTAQRTRNAAIQAYVAQIAEAYDEAITARFQEIPCGTCGMTGGPGPTPGSLSGCPACGYCS